MDRVQRRLLVASTGGHLTELVALAPRLRPAADEQHWVTFDSAQSRNLLASEHVTYVRDTPPRDLMGVLANLRSARRIIGDFKPDEVVSNGAGIALSFLPLARARGLPAHYIECSARTEGPSLTGRALLRVPGVRRYTQHERWAGRRWAHAGSIFDAFTPVPGPPARELGRVVVTVGTQTFGFRRLVERLAALLVDAEDVVWQTGGTDVTGLGIEATPFMPAGALDEAIAAADLVISHAGIGTALAALEAGRQPILIPRLRAHGEHVDDHQLLIAAELSGRGLAVTTDPEDLIVDDLLAAAGAGVARVADPPPFDLAR